MTDGLYAYAVVWDRREHPLPDVTGVEGAAIGLVSAGALAAVVSGIDTEVVAQRTGTDEPADLAWLERTARAHDAVVRAVCETAAVVPLRLGLVFRDEASVRARLTAVRDTVEAVLHRVEGCAEWGVKMYADVPGAEEPEPAGTAAPSPASGTAYLRQRRSRLTAQNDALQLAETAAEQAFERLAGKAVDARRYPPQDRRLTGDPRPMSLNAAFLVPVREAATFSAEIDELAGDRPPGTVVLTGPWAPYSFASLGEEL